MSDKAEFLLLGFANLHLHLDLIYILTGDLLLVNLYVCLLSKDYLILFKNVISMASLYSSFPGRPSSASAFS